jgi:hypothetical protein
MATTKKITTQIRSVQELNVRYIRFCINNELDETISPHLQVAESDNQQSWLDSHVAKLQTAQLEGVKLARNRTAIVREIANDSKAKRKIKNAITNAIVNVAVDMTAKARSFVPGCILNSKPVSVTVKEVLETPIAISSNAAAPLVGEKATIENKPVPLSKKMAKAKAKQEESSFGQMSFGLF